MPSKSYAEADHLIAPEELAEHAGIAVIKNAVAGIPDLADWVRGSVRTTPCTIHDINGQPLFQDFEVASGKEVFGTVRMAASKVLGTGAIALQLGPRSWNYDDAVKKLVPKVKREYPRARISAPKLVCYSYPKLGVMFEIEAENGRSTAIYDIGSLTRVPPKPDGPAREGFYAWSFYESLAEADRKRRLTRFAKVDADRDALPLRLRREIVNAATLESIVKKTKWPLKLVTTRKLQYCTHYGATHARSHHCFVLHGQQVNDYCAVATCQMILCYYRYYYAQDAIAPSLGYAPGGCPSDQSPGYKSLTCNHLDSSFDSAATWEKARDQIDLLRPFKSGIAGHARACAGYSRVVWLFGGGTTERKLYIYDPWDWNADYALGGAVYWEDWDAITHTNYVYAHIKCP